MGKDSTTYQHLEHRLEIVENNFSKKHNIFFINDSKATNIESTLVAIQSFPKNILLLLGGDPKGESFLPLAKYLGHNIKKIYPFGKASQNIIQDLDQKSVYLNHSSQKMFQAFEKAVQDAENGDIVLLSPACASFDEFQNFEHRGKEFKKQVHQLKDDA